VLQGRTVRRVGGRAIDSATLRLLSELAARARRQLDRLHGMGNRRPHIVAGEPVRRGGATFVWIVSWSEAETARANRQVVGGEAETCRARRRLLVRDGDSSCETETPRARQRLFVRGGGLSEKPPPSRRLVEEASNWSETRRLDDDDLDKDP
jgi:hypothetical protein